MLVVATSLCSNLNYEIFALFSPALHCRESWATASLFSVTFHYLHLSHNQSKHFPNLVNAENGEIFWMHDNEQLSDVRLSLDLVRFMRNLNVFVDKMPILTSLIPTTVSFGIKSPPLNVREIQGWRPSRISRKGCWLKIAWYSRAIVYYSSNLVTPCKTLFGIFPGVEETIAR